MEARSQSNESQTAIAAAEYILRRWCIVASARGSLRVRPAGGVLTIEEMAALLALLDSACDKTFPSVLLLDLEGVKVAGELWSLLEGMLAAFAEAVGLACRPISGRNQPLSAICLFRHPHV
jgi:hypothetical protein